MSAITTGLGIGGTALSASAAYSQAVAQNAANKANALQYDQAAQNALYNADIARSFGEQEQADVLLQYQRLRGEQQAAYGASGVAVGSGSALAVTNRTLTEGIYEGQKANYARQVEAWNYERQADHLSLQATTLRNSYVNPYIPAASAAIGGGTSVYSAYTSWKK